MMVSPSGSPERMSRPLSQHHFRRNGGSSGGSQVRRPWLGLAACLAWVLSCGAWLASLRASSAAPQCPLSCLPVRHVLQASRDESRGRIGGRPSRLRWGCAVGWSAGECTALHAVRAGCAPLVCVASLPCWPSIASLVL